MALFLFQALGILGLRDKEYREGDANVLKEAFAKKMANPGPVGPVVRK